ncbi:MAG: beta-ketoacyl-[acyl-carrier-protein] synthase I, partial [Pseudomonadota bacterium]
AFAGWLNHVVAIGRGAVRCMRQAMAPLDTPIDYINTHGTSTPVGDTSELVAIKETFGNKVPMLSSTKSLAGHSQGATGVQEVIYSLLMLDNDFVAASANIETLDPDAEGMNIVTERRDNAGLTCVMSNSFGFGGTNACLVFKKLAE